VYCGVVGEAGTKLYLKCSVAFQGLADKCYDQYVRHEAARKDEGRPLGVGLQKQALNHLKLHLLRAGVVSVKEKA